MESVKIVENVMALGNASNNDVLKMISDNSSTSRAILKNSSEFIKKAYNYIGNCIKSETNKSKKAKLNQEFNSFKVQVAKLTTALKVQKAHVQSNARQHKKLETILSGMINNPSQTLDQETSNEIKGIKETLQKTKENLLEILKDRKIFDEFQKKIDELKTIKHKGKYSYGIGVLASLLSGSAIGLVAGTEGCCGAAGCIAIPQIGLSISGVGLIFLGIGYALSIGLVIGFATYQIFKKAEKDFGNSKEMKEMLEIIEKQNQLLDSCVCDLKKESNLNELEQIYAKIGTNPMKYEQDRDICQRLSKEDEEIIKSLDEIIKYNESMQNVEFA